MSARRQIGPPMHTLIKTALGDGVMWLFSAILLAVSLSMDALGIGISYGLRKVRVATLPKVIISLISLIFTALAIGIGNVIALILPDQLAKLIGSAMLVVLGVIIIVQALSGSDSNESKKKPTPKTWSWTIKSLGVSIRITRAPVDNDIDKAPAINVKESLYLGVALSIDSFGAGISSAVAGVNSFLVPVLVGLCQFVFLSLGLYCGSKLTAIQKLKSNFFMFLSGTILITLACVRYFL